MLSLLVLLSPAFALSNFPGEISNDLGMPCTPTCALCHASAGGGGLASQPFGMAMKQRGLTTNTSSISGALDGMATDLVDSDSDGVTDLDQLANGENPNPDGVDFCAAGGGGAPPLAYGCSSQGPSPRQGLVALGIGLVGLAFRRRRSQG